MLGATEVPSIWRMSSSISWSAMVCAISSPDRECQNRKQGPGTGFMGNFPNMSADATSDDVIHVHLRVNTTIWTRSIFWSHLIEKTPLMPSSNTQSVDFPGRDRLLRWVVSGFSTVAGFQQFCGVKDNSGAPNPIHAIFVAGAALGNELFFITFLPALFWFVDFNVGRRVVTAWAFAYWVGQVLKDSLKLPRPDKEVVIQLEHHYAAEYGMPSTHAMNAILMPFYILYLLDDRIQHGHVTLLALAMLWLVLCTLSRLYMGVHSVPDILVGLGIGLICLALGVGYGAVIDDLIFTSTWSWAAIPVVCCLAVALYPRPNHWVNSPGDTAIIIGGTYAA